MLQTPVVLGHGVEFSNTYAELPEPFYLHAQPAKVREPRLFLYNRALADELGVAQELSCAPDTLARVLSGNELLPGSQPLALAYAGHQFGNFVPRLGDGRAHWLGEVIARDGRRWDLQLKGSGPTPFSRGGDGRCALGPAVREFIMSEAMHALGVPTTRCLAVVATGEPVYRDSLLPGAVVTRVAASHIRVGTFQYFSARGDHQAVKELADYAIGRHDPQLLDQTQDRYLAFLESAADRQIKLVVEWMRVGFIHGVMNTDNTAISGETLDYGPCAMMGHYNPATVFSSIDRNGRYAFANQPTIARWNMMRLADSLLPLIDADQDKAVERASKVIGAFADRFQSAWLNMMRNKLGLVTADDSDSELAHDLLKRMERDRLDYTVTFAALGASLNSEAQAAEMKSSLTDWYERWRGRVAPSSEQAQAQMSRANPLVIPRNHHMEAVLSASLETAEPAAAERFLDVLRQPYTMLEHTAAYQDPPADHDATYRTFCGT